MSAGSCATIGHANASSELWFGSGSGRLKSRKVIVPGESTGGVAANASRASPVLAAVRQRSNSTSKFLRPPHGQVVDGGVSLQDLHHAARPFGPGWTKEERRWRR